MFGFGLVEGLIVLALLSWVFKDWIARRWPRLGASLRAILLMMLIGVLLFDLIAYFNKTSVGG